MAGEGLYNGRRAIDGAETGKRIAIPRSEPCQRHAPLRTEVRRFRLGVPSAVSEKELRCPSGCPCIDPEEAPAEISREGDADHVAAQAAVRAVLGVVDSWLNISVEQSQPIFSRSAELFRVYFDLLTSYFSLTFLRKKSIIACRRRDVLNFPVDFLTKSTIQMSWNRELKYLTMQCAHL